MPIIHQFDRELNILFVNRSGSISSQDVQRAFRERQADPRIGPGIPVFVDCRHVDPADDSDMVKYIARKVTSLPARLRCGPLAIVVATDAQFETARMYQILSGNDKRTQIFLDYDEALRWLLDPERGHWEAEG